MLHEMPRETLRNAVATLDAFRATVPVGGSVSFARDGEDRGPDFADATSTMRMQWRSVDISKETLRVDKAGALHAEPRAVSLSAHGVSSSDLLMLCLPHHKSVMTNMRPVNSLQPYDSIKGPLTPVAGNTWLLHLRHATTGNFYAQTSPLSAARPEWQEAIRTALHKDAMFNISAETTDPCQYRRGDKQRGPCCRCTVWCEHGSIAHVVVVVAFIGSRCSLCPLVCSARWFRQERCQAWSPGSDRRRNRWAGARSPGAYDPRPPQGRARAMA